MLEEQKEILKKVLLRAVNRNQILILSHIDNTSASMTFVLKAISKQFNVPLSTLKLNARILKDLGLITYGNTSDFRKPRLTDTGNFVLKIITSRVSSREERPAVDVCSGQVSPADARRNRKVGSSSLPHGIRRGDRNGKCNSKIHEL